MGHIGTQEIISNRLILRKFSQNDSKEIFNGFRNQKEFLYYTNKKKCYYWRTDWFSKRY